MYFLTIIEASLPNVVRQQVCLAAFAICFVTWCGCSPRLSPVQGTVTLADGSPVVGATVVFDDPVKQISGSGSTDETGKYRLTTNEPDDGALPGEYLVSVHQPHAADSSQPAPARIFSRRYESRETSGLKFTVEPGDNTFDIKLDRP